MHHLHPHFDVPNVFYYQSSGINIPIIIITIVLIIILIVIIFNIVFTIITTAIIFESKATGGSP